LKVICINIKEVIVTGNDEICTNCIDEITNNYLNKCLTLLDIDKMLQEVTNYYINKGFVTSRAYMNMPQKRIKEGVLEIKIVEGKVSKIEGINKRGLWTAFPFIVGKILNIRDVEQGLDQMNRLPSNQAIMDMPTATINISYWR
jgi:hemolysin activation/secretion protein